MSNTLRFRPTHLLNVVKTTRQPLKWAVTRASAGPRNHTLRLQSTFNNYRTHCRLSTTRHSPTFVFHRNRHRYNTARSCPYDTRRLPLPLRDTHPRRAGCRHKRRFYDSLPLRLGTVQPNQPQRCMRTLRCNDRPKPATNQYQTRRSPIVQRPRHSDTSQGQCRADATLPTKRPGTTPPP